MKNKELEVKVSNQLYQVSNQLRESAEKIENLNVLIEEGKVRSSILEEIRILKSALGQLDHLDFVLFGEEQTVRS